MGEKICTTGEMWKRPYKKIFFISVGIAGGVSGIVVGFGASTDLSPVLVGLLAGLLSAFVGTAAFLAGHWLVKE